MREYRDESLTSTGAITDGGSAFLLESLMPSNPINNMDNYSFDYKLKSYITTPIYKGPVVYYVNSNDGSIAFTADENPEIKHHLSAYLVEPHFGIRKANGNILVCGLYRNDQTGDMEKRGMDIGNNTPLKTLFTETIADQMTWLNSAEPLSGEGLDDALTPGQIEIVESSLVESKRGRVASSSGTTDQIIDFYFIPFPVMERISTPFMGVNVGIMKDFKKKINSLVIYAVVRNVDWKGGKTNLHFYLDGLYQANATFSPAAYKVATAFNKQGMKDGKQFQEELMTIGLRIKQLSQLIADCPKGSAGAACREPYKREKKELEATIEQKTKEFMQQHKLE
ncbi:MAG: hypothetical protein ACK5JD_01475 [Mangrovibacterium sp.]